MNKEIETQFDAVLNYSTLTNLRKSEDELLTTRCLLINYHNVCLNLKQALNEIREYVNSDKLLKRLIEPKINNKGETHFDLIREDILQIIDKVLGDEDNECK